MLLLPEAVDDYVGPDNLPDQQFEVHLVPRSGHGAQVWRGPRLGTGGRLDVELVIHTGMGPGGVMFRNGPSGRPGGGRRSARRPPRALSGSPGPSAGPLGMRLVGLITILSAVVISTFAGQPSP